MKPSSHATQEESNKHMSMDQDLPLTFDFENYRPNWSSRNLESTKRSGYGRINWFPEDLESKMKKYGEIEEIEDAVERRFNRLRNFNIAPDPPLDHHYLPRRDNAESRFRLRIKQEWDLLYEHTPTSTFVRAYEHRMDLMRVAVIGPPGSDFHHCLFFFDIFFPRNYPLDPPELYNSPYGLELKPKPQPECGPQTWCHRVRQNLHGSNKKEERKPLLEKEVWNPKESNILSVLDVIQNLVLDMKTKSLDDERTFVLACNSMIAVMRTPPMRFECLVVGHFRRSAHPVLLKFKENKYDSEVMINLFVKLFKAFEGTGTYCKHHLDFLKSRKLSIEEVEARISSLEGQQRDDEFSAV